MISLRNLEFIKESNRIEGILREPTEAEILEFERFMAQDAISIEDMIQFVSVYQPGAVLRDRAGLNVRIGYYIPPAGDITIKTRLMDILTDAKTLIEDDHVCSKSAAYGIHQRYEHLHPFTDGNGRSGRMLWMWMVPSSLKTRLLVALARDLVELM